jgi:hypothetical protein
MKAKPTAHTGLLYDTFCTPELRFTFLPEQSNKKPATERVRHGWRTVLHLLTVFFWL